MSASFKALRLALCAPNVGAVRLALNACSSSKAEHFLVKVASMHSKYVIFYSNGLDINLPGFFLSLLRSTKARCAARQKIAF